MESNTADTGGPGRHARDRKPRTAAAPPGGGTAGQELPGWQRTVWAGRHAAHAPDGHAQSTGADPARGDGSPAEHAPVARRTATGWRVGDEEVSDLTSAMVLADLLAADLPTQAMPTVSGQAAPLTAARSRSPQARADRRPAGTRADRAGPGGAGHRGAGRTAPAPAAAGVRTAQVRGAGPGTAGSRDGDRGRGQRHEPVAAHSRGTRQAAGGSPPRSPAGPGPRLTGDPRPLPVLARQPLACRAGQPRAASTCWAISCSPSLLGWNGTAGEVGMRPSTHLVPGAWHASWPMLAV